MLRLRAARTQQTVLQKLGWSIDLGCFENIRDKGILQYQRQISFSTLEKSILTLLNNVLAVSNWRDLSMAQLSPTYGQSHSTYS
jgi:hypothetical protein